MPAFPFSMGFCAATVVFSVHCGAVIQAADAFQESGGRVVMEVESVALAGSWTKETYAAGYTGTGFYEWKKGNTSTKTDAAGSGILSYPVAISTTGRYRLQVRGQPAHNTEHNDVWIRVLGATKVEAVRSNGSDVRNLGANWTKSYNNSAGSWTWNTNTVDHDAHWFFVEAQAGTTITVELSGRSAQFKVDRIVLYTSAHTTAQATNPALPESPRGGSTPPPTNTAPSVDAGPNRSVTLPGSAALDGTVSDDGLPAATLATTWSKLSGPGTVIFGSTGAVDTAAGFSAAGTYILRLTASDGSLSAYDDMTVVVASSGTPSNTAPTVNAGPNMTVVLPASATLNGTVGDDGLPTGALTTTWSKLSGPGTVSFGSATAIDTTAAFSLSGIYVLRLSASDGSLNTHDDVTVTVDTASVPAPASSAPASTDGGGDDSGCGLGFGAVACLLALTVAFRGQGVGLNGRQP